MRDITVIHVKTPRGILVGMPSNTPAIVGVKDDSVTILVPACFRAKTTLADAEPDEHVYLCSDPDAHSAKVLWYRVQVVKPEVSQDHIRLPYPGSEYLKSFYEE